jgi:hypothetical protein
MFDTILAEYRRSLEAQGEQELKAIAEHYGLADGLQDRQAIIDALVKHFRRQLEENA